MLGYNLTDEVLSTVFTANTELQPNVVWDPSLGVLLGGGSGKGGGGGGGEERSDGDSCPIVRVSGTDGAFDAQAIEYRILPFKSLPMELQG